MAWYFETLKDHEIPEFRQAIMTENCADEILTKCAEEVKKQQVKFEERWADGRAFVAGANVTAADFQFLAGFTCMQGKDGQGNPGLKNPAIATKIREACADATHTTRVLNNIMALCQAQIDTLQPTMI